MKNLSEKFHFKTILFVSAGAFLYSLAVNIFLAPNNVAPGGVTGIATALNHLFPFLPTGTLTFLFNIPLFVVGYREIGKNFIISTVLTTFTVSVFLDITALIPAYTQDRLLSALLGGALMGIGLGIVMRCGTTTGGADIIVRVLRKRNPALSVAFLIFTLDLFVVVFAALAYREVTSALYSVIAIFVSSTVTDKIVSGADDGKLVHIMTDSTEKMAEAIAVGLSRGVTLLHAKGHYTGKEKDVIMVVIRRYQLASLRRIVKETDDKAFIIFSDATAVFGNGFHIQE